MSNAIIQICSIRYNINRLFINNTLPGLICNVYDPCPLYSNKQYIGFIISRDNMKNHSLINTIKDDNKREHLTLLSLGFFGPCKSGGGLFVPAVYISWSTYGFCTKLGQCLHWAIIFTIIKKKLTWRHFCHLLTSLFDHGKIRKKNWEEN